MFKSIPLKIKPFLIVFVLVLIAGSFLFLKIQQRNIDPTENNPQIVDNDDDLVPVQLTQRTSNIKQFSNLSEFNQFVESQSAVMGGGLGRGDVLMTTDAVSFSDDFAVRSESSLDKGSLDYSDTNIQVEGVDEADIVKTDGDYIYYLRSNELIIVKSFPVEEAEILSRIKLDDNPLNMYIKDEVLVVFGNSYNNIRPVPMMDTLEIGSAPAVRSDIMPYFYDSGYVFVDVFDISDKANPLKVRDVEIEGSYFNSRLIDNDLYFIVNNYSYYRPNLPVIMDKGRELSFNCQEGIRCADHSIYYLDDDYDSLNLTSIVSLDVLDQSSDLNNYFYLLPASQGMYVSQDNIYLTYTKYLNEYEIETTALLNVVYPRLSQKDRDTIAEINDISANILNESEKKYRIRRIVDAYVSILSKAERDDLDALVKLEINSAYPNLIDELEQTVIHKLAISEGLVEPMYMAEVSGTVLNQFSMDEYDSYFRIATTRNSSWSRFDNNRSESYSNLFVLNEELEKVGEIRDLAEGERIYSVRFMGDKAYMVTFRDIDPLFSIDLSNPFQPLVLGELKIPGFSNYLHPYDENILIGFGMQTEENERSNVVTTGIKLSLFDVSQLEPSVIDDYIIGDSGSYSIALYDHRAFLFSKAKNIIAVPATLREKIDDNRWGQLVFDGLLVFSYTDGSLVLEAQIDHLSQDFSNPVVRSLYIEDSLYSFSNNMLKIHDLDGYSELRSLSFDE